MQQITLQITNNENVGTLSTEQLKQIQDIMLDLVTSGSLSGVKGGQTIIHFDHIGKYMGIQISYWPRRRRKEENGY